MSLCATLRRFEDRRPEDAIHSRALFQSAIGTYAGDVGLCLKEFENFSSLGKYGPNLMSCMLRTRCTLRVTCARRDEGELIQITNC